MGGTGNGGIGAAGTAVENQMDKPAAAAGQQLSGNPLMGPGQITAATGGDHKRTSRTRSRLGRMTNNHEISCLEGQLIGASCR
jgi:PPE-repeat protein